MQAKTRVWARFEHAIFEHARGPAEVFFGGLEDERHGARQFAPAFGEQLGHNQQNGRVAVMTTGVMGARHR